MFRGKVGLPDYECDLCSEVGRHRGVFNHNAQVSRTFAVQPKVLAKALGAEDLKALVDKEADGPGVCVQGSTGKALVRAVKEDKKVSRFANLRNLSPLLFSGIQTSGVMSAGMQDENSSRRCLAQIFQHA